MKGMYLIDDIAITEAGLRDAVQQHTKKGECEMTTTRREPRHWKIKTPPPEPPPPIELVTCESDMHAVVSGSGHVEIRSTIDEYCFTGTGDLRGLIASLQSILALAEEHFGEDWGK